MQNHLNKTVQLNNLPVVLNIKVVEKEKNALSI